MQFVSQAKRYFQPPCRRLPKPRWHFYLLDFLFRFIYYLFVVIMLCFKKEKNNFICCNKRVLKGVLQQTMRDALTERVLDFYDYSLKIFENSPVHPHNCCLIMCKRTLIKNWKEALLVRIKQCLHNLNVIFAVFKQHVVSTVTILLQLSPRIFFFWKTHLISEGVHSLLKIAPWLCIFRLMIFSSWRKHNDRRSSIKRFELDTAFSEATVRPTTF